MKKQTAIIGVLTVLVVIAGCEASQQKTYTPAELKLDVNERYILTPKAPPEPRINGAKVFGVRPGSPFLFTIAATGNRPIAFEAQGLPEGLTLDKQTGHISGKVDKPGTYTVTLKASNSLGTTNRELKIVVGDQIALTPPMGWNSWNCWAGEVSDKNVRDSAKAMADSGLVNHGWTYINIDDAWQGARGGKYNAIQSNEKFPDMTGLCNYVHSLGLKIGIYSTPWVTSYAGYIGGSSDNEDDSWEKVDGYENYSKNNRLGKYTFDTNDAKQWGDWGIDYLKYDWNPNDEQSTKRMADALRSSGRDIVYSLSNSAPFGKAAIWAKLANCWRTTGDIRDAWSKRQVPAGEQWACGLTEIWQSHLKWAPFNGPGHWNDADMLVVGKVGWGTPHPSKLTPDEQYTHISLWCLWSSPLLIGCPLDQLDDFTLNLLTNDEVLAINQDPLGKLATQVSKTGATQVLAKDLEDGSKAVGFFNTGEEPNAVKVTWEQLGVTGNQTVRDLWRQKNIGTYADEFEVMVRPHGVILVRVSPDK
jgi:alpha-galactosidase